MIIDGYTPAKIMKELHLSERTYYRYLDVIFAEEKAFLSENISREEMRRQYMICRDRLLQNMREVKQWLKDDPKSKDRCELMHLSSEIAAAICRIYDSGPGVLASRHTFPQTSATGPDSTGLRLILRKRSPQDQEEQQNIEEEKEEEEREE